MNPINHVIFLLRKGGRVILGAHSRTKREEEEQVIEIAEEIRYPDYCPKRKEHDIMLLKV